MAKTLSTTPKGKAIYPRLTGEPDYKFDKAGVWSVKLENTAADGAALVTAIDAAMQGALVEAKEKFVVAKAEYAALKSKSGKKPPKEPELVDAPYFVDEDTGNITFTFKMKASGESKKKVKFTQKPTIFDAKGQPIKGEIKLGGGSTIRVSYEIIPFVSPIGAGASLRLKAVQVLELVEWGSGNADYYGFDSEEGYVAPEQTTEATPAEQAGFTEEATPAAPGAGTESDDF